MSPQGASGKTEIAQKATGPRAGVPGADLNYRKENEMLQFSVKFNLVIRSPVLIAALAAWWNRQ